MSLKVFSDIDGVVTVAQKMWLTTMKRQIAPVARGRAVTMTPSVEQHEIQISKQFSDHDSVTIDIYRKHLIFISHDEKINRKWCEYRRVPFMYVPGKEEKFEHVCDHLTGERCPKKRPEYIYIGDTIKDEESLIYSVLGYVPQDAAESLIRKVRKLTHIQVVPRLGGNGVLDWVFCDLVDRGIIEEPK